MGLGGLFAGGIPRLPNKGAKFGGGGGGPRGEVMDPVVNKPLDHKGPFIFTSLPLIYAFSN